MRGMTTTVDRLGLYLHLARAARMRRRPLVRDRMLVLAGMLAHEADLPRVAAACRREILLHNANHVVGRYNSFAAAAEDEAFQTFYRRLAQRFPPEKAEHMLNSLGIVRGEERASYFDDEEYAASLLGQKTEELDAPAARSVHAEPASKGALPRASDMSAPGNLIAIRTVLLVVCTIAAMAIAFAAWRYFRE